MKKFNSQQGSAHLIIILLLTVGLIVSLGYIFWQNYTKIDNKNNSAESKSNNSSDFDNYKKTYATAKLNISFKYPDNWNVTDSSSDSDAYFYNFFINNEKGEAVANLAIVNADKAGGRGGTCDNTSVYSVIEANSTSLKADKPISQSYMITKIQDNKYVVNFGLTNQFTKIETGDTCYGLAYFTFNTTLIGNNNAIIDFNNYNTKTKEFVTENEARDYLRSDEYTKIKDIMMSFQY